MDILHFMYELQSCGTTKFETLYWIVLCFHFSSITNSSLFVGFVLSIFVCLVYVNVSRIKNQKNKISPSMDIAKPFTNLSRGRNGIIHGHILLGKSTICNKILREITFLNSKLTIIQNFITCQNCTYWYSDIVEKIDFT